MRSIISRCKIAKNLSTNRLLLLSWSNYDLFHTSVMNRKRVECLWRASNVLELIGTYESTFLGWQEFASRTSKIYCDSLFVGLKILVHVCFFYYEFISYIFAGCHFKENSYLPIEIWLFRPIKNRSCNPGLGYHQFFLLRTSWNRQSRC